LAAETSVHATFSSFDEVKNTTGQYSEILTLFRGQIKSRRKRWPGHVARMGKRKEAYRVLVGNPEGKRQLGRPRCRWEDNIKMDLQEVGWGMDWIDLAQDRDRWRALVKAVSSNEPSGSIKCRKFLD
jgi:hypothetical protein